MMMSASILAASLPTFPTFAENLQYQITGLLVVIFTLGGMALIVWLAGKLFAIRDRRKATTAESVTTVAESIPGEIQAAIAAAVAVALADRHFVIYGVRSADPRGNLAWGAEGRRSIYASRKLR